MDRFGPFINVVAMYYMLLLFGFAALPGVLGRREGYDAYTAAAAAGSCSAWVYACLVAVVVTR